MSTLLKLTRWQKMGNTLIIPNVEILPGRGLNNEDLVRLTNGKAGRSTIRKHRTDENNEV